MDMYPAHDVWLISVSARSHMGLGPQLLLHLGSRKSEAKEFSTSAPVESDIKKVRFSELQDDPKQQHTYPSFLPKKTLCILLN